MNEQVAPRYSPSKARLIESHSDFDAAHLESFKQVRASLIGSFPGGPPQAGSAVWVFPVVVAECLSLSDPSLLRRIALSTVAIDAAARHLDAAADGPVPTLYAAHAATRLAVEAVSYALVASKGDERVARRANELMAIASQQELWMLNSCGTESLRIHALGGKLRYMLIGVAAAAAATGQWNRLAFFEEMLGRVISSVQMVDDMVDVTEDVALGRWTILTQELRDGIPPNEVIQLSFEMLLQELAVISTLLRANGAPISADKVDHAWQQIAIRLDECSEVIGVADIPPLVRRAVPIYLQYG